MLRLNIVLLRIMSLFLFFLYVCTFADAKSFYVSTVGNDAYCGQTATISPEKKQGPFRTLEKGLDAIRTYRREHTDLVEPLILEIMPGIYELDKTLVIDGTMSGTEKSRTIIRGIFDPKLTVSCPIISGGRMLNGWKVLANGNWELQLNDVKNGQWNFTQLFVNGQRRFRPRLPKSGTWNITERIVPKGEDADKPDTQFQFAEGQLNSHWKNLGDTEIIVCHNWTISRNLIKSIDDTSRTVTVQGSSPSKSSWGVFTKGNRFFLENVASALSEPGEWYLDRTSGILTYIPQPGETPDNTIVVAPKIEYLMNVIGEKEQRARNIDFINLVFAHSNWTTPQAGCISPQAEVNIDGSVRVTGAEHCDFIHCGWKHIGHYALAFGTASHHCTVTKSEMKDIAAGGIRIGGDIWNSGHWPYESLKIASLQTLPEEERLVTNINVHDNYLSYLGRIHPSGIGVWIGHAANCSVTENEIFDLYYSATSIGWVWGYGKSLSHHNIIRRNHMYKIGQKFLSDMGAVYTLGISPGTMVTENLIHDISSFSYGGWGLYTDEGSTGIEMSRNIVYNTKTGSFHQHYGKDNRIVNNIFVNAIDQQIQRTRMEKHRSFLFENNIIYWTNKSPLLGSNWQDNEYTMNKNIYWNPNHEIKFAGLTFEQWKGKKGQDKDSMITDPLFRDVEKHDFRLSPDSPALKLGFLPIEGPFGPHDKANILNTLPEPPVAFPLEK